MSDDQDVTPIDRPLMRSDLNEIRQIVWNISQRQVNGRRGAVGLTVICVLSALVSLGCAVAGIR